MLRYRSRNVWMAIAWDATRALVPSDAQTAMNRAALVLLNFLSSLVS